MLDELARNFRYSLRSFAHAPLFTAAVVLTLGFGIGANTAIFSVVDRLLLQPLPYPDGERVMMLHESTAQALRMDVSPANWMDWQRDSRSFEGLAAWTNRLQSTITGEGEPERVKSDLVSHEFFTVLGVKPLLGRAFTAEDDRPGVPARVVVSYSLWQRKFGGLDNVVGRQIQLNAAPAEIVGVMPMNFRFVSADTEVWIPFRLDRSLAWREVAGRFLPFVVGRLKPAVTLQAAQSEMTSLAARLAAEHRFNRETSVNIIPLREVLTGEVRGSLLVLFAAVGVLFLIACVNVANLLMARAASRRQEIAIRTSLGAGRGAIVRQLVLESVLLAAAGGIAAVAFAKWDLSVLLARTPPGLLQLTNVPIDWRLPAYAFALSFAAGLVLGLVPAMPAMRGRLGDYLRDRTRSVTTPGRLRQALIVVQVAMTVVLLCAAGLLNRSLFALTGDPVGVQAANVLTMRVDLPAARYTPPQQLAFFRQLFDDLRGLPGVESVSGARDIPLSTARLSITGFHIEGDPVPAPNQGPSTVVRVAAPEYFKTLQIPMLQGREFTDADLRPQAAPLLVVNQAFVKKYLEGRDPLSVSMRVQMGTNTGAGTIIGIAADVKERSLRGVAEPTVFYNNGQLPTPGLSLLIRSRQAAALAPRVIQTIRNADPNLPVAEVRMLEAAFGESVARERLTAVMSAAFGVSALLLASLGLYGLLACSVAERTNEIGIRIALGARTSQILRLISLSGARLVAIGGAAGMVLAFAVLRLIKTLLFGVTPYDPLTFVSAAALLVVVAGAAVVVPAWRAATTDPLVALRRD